MTERFAQVVDGIVANIIVLAAGVEYPRDGLVADPQAAAVIGGTYAAGVFTPPPVDPAAVAQEIEDRLDVELDAIARAWGYKSANRLASYYNDPNPTWQAESRAFVAGRSAWWQAAMSIQNAWASGDPLPTYASVRAQMPEIVRPGNGS